jgi:hypothetical protein
MAGSSLPDIAEKYRKGVSNVIDWGYDFKDKVRNDFLKDQLVPANMAYAQRQFLQNELSNQVTQEGWDGLRTYGLNQIGKNAIQSATDGLKTQDAAQIYGDTRQQLADTERNNAAAGLSTSQTTAQTASNGVLETDAKTVYGQLSSKHSGASNNYDRANAILAEVQSDPSLRANPTLVKMAVDEAQKQAAVLQSQGIAGGLPGAAEAGSRGTGSAVTMQKSADGRLVPAYGSEAGNPIDIQGEAQRKFASDRAASLEKTAESWKKLADATEDETLTKQYLGNAAEALHQAHVLRTGGVAAPSQRLESAAATIGIPGTGRTPYGTLRAAPPAGATGAAPVAPAGYRYGLDGRLYRLPSTAPYSVQPSPAASTAPQLPTMARVAPYLPYDRFSGN